MRDLTAGLVHAVATPPAREPVVAVVGDLNYDTIYRCPALEAGREVLITGWSRELAGAGGIVACCLARLGANVLFCAGVGDDEDGHELIAELKRRRVPAEGVRAVPGARSAFTLIFSDEAGGRPRQVATFAGVSAGFTVPAEERGALVRRVELVCSVNYFILPRLAEDIPGLFQAARAAGVRTAYDANAGDGWDDPSQLALLLERIHPLTDVIFLNEDEARCLTAEGDPSEAARVVQPPEAMVVVKCGDRGAVVRDGGRLTRVGAFPLPGPVRDTVGAGDTFQATFLYFLLCGLPTEGCAALASANAASTVLAPGGTSGQLDRAGLAAFLSGYRITEGEDGNVRVQQSKG